MVEIFAPVVDGRSLTRHPFDPTAPEISADIPMIVGSTADEMYAPYDATFGEDELRVRMKLIGFSAAQTESLIKIYRTRQPAITAGDLLYKIASEKLCQAYVFQQAERKLAQGGAPAYRYLFACGLSWSGGPRKAIHAIDVPFVFSNVRAEPGEFGPNPARAVELGKHMSGAWAAFARTGEPNHAGLPHWPAYTASGRETMRLDVKSQVVSDPQREDRLALQAVSNQ